ncbi:MAG: linear amide C-N hydrolase, partial [Desulfobacterales bacterium]|nr:linear amide C-N hydrolase [Desulfobacterales bacterium]
MGQTLFLILNIFLILVPQTGQTCTTFALEHNAQHVVGKNFDWMVDDGLIIINKRGVSKKAIVVKDAHGGLATWTSKYGSVTFNQHGRELPHGGMNETGLVVQAMMLPGSIYPPPDSRPAISRLQWIQYQLDNSSSIKEIIASDSILRIGPSGGPGPHFLCIDKQGDAVSIEFIDGKLVYHSKETMPYKALTNSTYETSAALFKTHEGKGNAFPMPTGHASGSRFVRTVSMIKQYQSKPSKPLVDYAFDILSNVAGPHTKWRMVFDIESSRVYFKTFSNPGMRYFDFSSFDLSCASAVKILDINAEIEGDVTHQFQDYRQQINGDLIRNAFKKTPSLKGVPEATLKY